MRVGAQPSIVSIKARRWRCSLGKPGRLRQEDRVNLLLLSPEDRLAGDRYRVTGPRLSHLRTVLKPAIGARLRAGLLDGPIGLAELCSMDEEAAELVFEPQGPAPARPSLHLILCIPRPKLLRRLLPELVALGLGRLTLLRSWRVAQPYLSSPLLSPEGYRPLVELGLMQAGCTRPPVIAVERAFKPFVEDRASTISGRKICLHPGAVAPLESLSFPQGPLTLAIGPEGGLVDFELEAFAQAGFQLARMGERVLRVETACVAAISQVNLLCRLGARG